jgi:two-component system, NtrC family, response regulator HydG
MYPWPGNIRDLKNVIGNACMMAEGNLIDIEDLLHRLRNTEHSDEEKFFRLHLWKGAISRRYLRGLGGDKLRAAQILGVSRSFLYNFERQRLNIIKDEMA